jgi:superfamily II DNA or RNA helicase
MSSVILQAHDANYVKVVTSPDVIEELFEEFCFYVPGYKFNPSFRKGWWDGKIRLLNKRTRLIYKGLAHTIKQLCEDREYTFTDEATVTAPQMNAEFVHKLIDMLKVPTEFERRAYQIDTILHCINNPRTLILSPTSSGKSFIQYVVNSYYAYKYPEKKILMIVPRINLVKQMESDFVSYGCDPEKIYTIQGGVDRVNIPAKVRYVITTWQSVCKEPESYFKQFSAVTGDEAHDYKSKALLDLVGKMKHLEIRHGFTGTLDGTQTHKMILEGLFGPVTKFIETYEMIEQGYASPVKIKVCMMKHTKENRKIMKGADYESEIQNIIGNEYRNKFINDLVSNLKGNTLVLFSRVEKHGKVLYEDALKRGMNAHLIYGGVDADEREAIRAILEQSDNAVVYASFQTFSTGANIKNLHNAVFATSGKGRIRNLQSIGRILRKHPSKEFAYLYDVVDDLSNGKKQNHTLKHLLEHRIPQYEEARFPYDITEYELKG